MRSGEAVDRSYVVRAEQEVIHGTQLSRTYSCFLAGRGGYHTLDKERRFRFAEARMYPGLSLLACLFYDERVPCYRPRDDVIRQLLDHPGEQLHECGRDAGVDHVLILLDTSLLSAIAEWSIFVVSGHVPSSITSSSYVGQKADGLPGCRRIG